MTVVSSYSLTSGHLWNGCFAEMRLVIQEEKHNIYLEKRQKHKHSSNMYSSKGQLRELTASKVYLRSSSQVTHPNRDISHLMDRMSNFD